MPVIPPIIFVGNKKDLTDANKKLRAVAAEDVAQLMKTCEEISGAGQNHEAIEDGWAMLHFEASALSGEKIDDMFEILIREISDRKKRNPSTVKKKKSSSWFGKWCNIL